MPTTKNDRSNNYTLRCWSSRHCIVCTFVHIHQAIGQDQFQNKKGFFCIFVIFGHFQSICHICHDQYRFLWTAIRGFISEFGLYFHGENFRLNRAPIKHWTHKQKLQKVLVQESESTFTFESNYPKASVPPFPVSSAPPPPSSPSTLKPRPPLLAVCQSSHLKLLPWATS